MLAVIHAAPLRFALTDGCFFVFGKQEDEASDHGSEVDDSEHGWDGHIALRDGSSSSMVWYMGYVHMAMRAAAMRIAAVMAYGMSSAVMADRYGPPPKILCAEFKITIDGDGSS